MKKIYISFLLIIFSFVSYSQELTLLTTLDESIKESSGLIYLNDHLITHNDSGGNPSLYELDSNSGNVTREVILSNATNIDWEDICYDDTYIYVADFGNNNGSRTDLKVYRLLISDYLTTPNDMVTVEIINFSYLDQTDFTPSPYTTNFDAEALISYNGSLYVFTKNWGDNWTNIYALPKSPGTYEIEKIDSINSQGLVTGATYNTISNKIVLTGYTVLSSFIIEISDIINEQFSDATIDQYMIDTPAGSSYQIESITYHEQNQYFLTAEESPTGNSGLYNLVTDGGLGLNDIGALDPFIYHNKAINMVQISNINLSVVEFYDITGSLIITSKEKQIDVSNLNSGFYFIVLKSIEGKRFLSKKLIFR